MMCNSLWHWYYSWQVWEITVYNTMHAATYTVQGTEDIVGFAARGGWTYCKHYSIALLVIAFFCLVFHVNSHNAKLKNLWGSLWIIRYSNCLSCKLQPTYVLYSRFWVKLTNCDLMHADCHACFHETTSLHCATLKSLHWLAQ